MSATKLVATFGPGPLGLTLATDNILVSVNPSGQAASEGLQAGDELAAVNGTSIAGKPHEEVLNLIKSQPRPMSLEFARKPALPEEPASKPAGGSLNAAAILAGVQSVTAVSAVSKAGDLMKGFIGASKQMIGALDRALDKAVEDGQRQAKVAARQARITSAAITRQRTLGGAGGLSFGSDSSLSLNLRGLVPRDPSLLAAQPEEDERLAATRAWACARARQLQLLARKNAELQAM